MLYIIRKLDHLKKMAKVLLDNRISWINTLITTLTRCNRIITCKWLATNQIRTKTLAVHSSSKTFSHLHTERIRPLSSEAAANRRYWESIRAPISSITPLTWTHNLLAMLAAHPKWKRSLVVLYLIAISPSDLVVHQGRGSHQWIQQSNQTVMVWEFAASIHWTSTTFREECKIRTRNRIIRSS